MAAQPIFGRRPWQTLQLARPIFGHRPWLQLTAGRSLGRGNFEHHFRCFWELLFNRHLFLIVHSTHAIIEKENNLKSYDSTPKATKIQRSFACSVELAPNQPSASLKHIRMNFVITLEKHMVYTLQFQAPRTKCSFLSISSSGPHLSVSCFVEPAIRTLSVS